MMYKKLSIGNRKITVVAVITLLTLTSVPLFVAFPAVEAHAPALQIPTFAYIQVAPNPVGVNQQVFVTFWLDKVLPGALASNDIRFHDYKLTITKPDGTMEVKTFPIVQDTTSSQYVMYTPTQIGTYTFKFEFPGQTYTWTQPIASLFGPPMPNVYTNDTYLPSSATTSLTVQQEPLTSLGDYPLPTRYWSRPIEGQNTNWAVVASNWLNSPQIVANVQPDGIAPDSPHIMWTLPLQNGGVVGGTTTAIPSVTYYTGMSYEGKFGNPIILQGKLYYPLPLSNDPGSTALMGSINPGAGGYACVDLQTGRRVWTQKYAVNPTFGQIYDYETRNQHGAIAYLWAVESSGGLYGPSVETWIAYEPETGNWLFNLTNVPSGTTEYTSKGEIVRYVFDAQNNWVALWNNTAAPELTGDPTGIGAWAEMWRPVGKVIDASTAYSWNVSVPATSPSASVFGVIPDDVLLIQANFPDEMYMIMGSWGTPDNCQIWAISLKPETRGKLLWTKIYAPPPNSVTRELIAVDPQTRMFYTYDKETMAFHGFSVDDGRQVWGPVSYKEAFGYYNYEGLALARAYGNLYASGYNGILYCIDGLTGEIEWTYGNGGAGNSTHSGLNAPYGNYPTFIGAVADGKVYLYNSEHSPNAPMWKGEKIRCVNALTGKELWTLDGWGTCGNFYIANGAIADGYYAYLNGYDMQIYCIGKGPSATTVSVSPKTATLGNPVLIEGTVTDICAGAKALVESGKFTVIPAISDTSQSSWMEYLYMQRPMPTNATGVAVHLTAIDPNGNYQDIGTATTDINGNYAIAWLPPVPGIYHVTATFEGTKSYFGSAQTAYFVVNAPLSASPTVATPIAQQLNQPEASPSFTPTTSPSVVPEPEATSTTADIYLIVAAAVILIVVVTVVALKSSRHK